jgi:hypothetical protein
MFEFKIDEDFINDLVGDHFLLNHVFVTLLMFTIKEVNKTHHSDIAFHIKIRTYSSRHVYLRHKSINITFDQ